MSTERQVLKLLRRDELLEVVNHFEVDVREGTRRATQYAIILF
jgi:hypothetical protein